MQVKIISIDAVGAQRRARRIVFDADVEPRHTSAAAVKANGLVAGSEFELEELVQALDAAEAIAMKERAIGLLKSRERSARELTTRLTDDGYALAAVTELVERYRDLHLVDDERFAGALARTKARAGLGPDRIRDALRRSGIDADVIDRILEETFENADQVNRACEALRGRPITDRSARERAIRRLVSRGFSLATALSAVNRLSDADRFLDDNRW